MPGHDVMACGCNGPEKPLLIPGDAVPGPAAARTVPDDDTTTVGVTVGGTYDGVLEDAGDRDWIALTLAAGETVRITLEGSGATPLSDPLLNLYGSDSTLLASNDDSGGTLDSALVFTATSAGTYYIEAAAFDDFYIGSYTVSVTSADPPRLLDALDWGGQTVPGFEDGVVTVQFVPQGTRLDGFTAEAFNAYEMARFRAAFDMISSLIDLRFEITTSATADFRLMLDTNEVPAGEFLGYFYPPGEGPLAGLGVFNGAEWDRTAGGTLETGGFDFVTVTHELLHGLGLAHPHDDGGGSAIFPGVTDAFGDYGDFGLNQGLYTTMSYNNGQPGGTPGAPGEDWGYEAGPMALDIALLQEKYGANTGTASGDTVYQIPERNGAGTYWQAIWDAGGTDTIAYGGSRDVVIDLRPATLQYEWGGGGFASQASGIAGGFTIAAGAVIENATGGRGDDRIVGNAVANVLTGAAGADVITAKDGDDDLIGGLGLDWLVGDGGADTFVYTSLADSPTGQGARDLINGFDHGADRIDLSAIDANARAAGDQAFAFIGTADFDGTGLGQVRYDTWAQLGVWSIVSVDGDGDGVADMQIFVNLTDTMAASDFIL